MDCSTSSKVNNQIESTHTHPSQTLLQITSDVDLAIKDIISQLKLPRKSQNAQLPSPEKTQNEESTNIQSISTSNEKSKKSDKKRKRGHHLGVIHKLGQLSQNADLVKKRPPKIMMSGHRMGGMPSSRVEPNYVVPDLVLAITRRISFSVYLKNAIQHFQSRKNGQIKLLAMGSAISMALSLAMAIEHNLKLSDGCSLVKKVKTGTVVVGDEIQPETEVSQFQFNHIILFG
ncbi:uncharacterized protein MELLADRAFT_60573 [Melampsora larici-populina 98AG31]|uniref:Uncharacterized protein n=1 Tax=Melampsora larici-populina (strain 98AG31 / pathotype 3-4-7) TaxID=747676 RepID=F4RBK5_MELLP|nr:uncharacterized protein MELLADRAFT_60573 [Melampsora larici-populina 98AG31]EGG10320.1 hypothetical protein MELLADRAFT_60573 [Melampsora larici-populina 98AG31]